MSPKWRLQDLALQARKYESAARKIMPITLERSGKSPNIVFPKMQILKAAVMGAISGICGDRPDLHCELTPSCTTIPIHDKFVKRFAEVAGAAKIGDPMSSDARMGRYF